MNSTAITDSGGDVSEVKLECHLEVKSEDSCGKTLTFEFSYPDVDPDEISHEFVSINLVDDMVPCKLLCSRLHSYNPPNVFLMFR